MVSFQTPKSPNQRKTIPDIENSSKKRKLEEAAEVEKNFKKWSKDESPNPFIDMELQLNRPLPLEWQRCLDIQSGQLHFYNTKTQKRTSKDPRQSPDKQSSNPGHMSLELELNLPYESVFRNHVDDDHNWTTKPDDHHNSQRSSSRNNPKEISRDDDHDDDDQKNQMKCLGGLLSRSPSWVSLDQEDHQEMVAAACMRCHMLVMLCKSSPSCPNCKFMHPPNQSPPNLFKPIKIQALML